MSCRSSWFLANCRILAANSAALPGWTIAISGRHRLEHSLRDAFRPRGEDEQVGGIELAAYELAPRKLRFCPRPRGLCSGSGPGWIEVGCSFSSRATVRSIGVSWR